MSGLGPAHVAARWKLHGREFEALRDYAGRHATSPATGKTLLARIGLVLAWAEHDDTYSPAPPLPAWLLKRAVHHARHVLDDYGEPLMAYEPFEPSIEDKIIAPVTLTPDPSPQQALTVEQLKACATSPQARLLLWALERGCLTLADVDRHYDWSHGQAAVVSSRLRRRMHALY